MATELQTAPAVRLADDVENDPLNDIPDMLAHAYHPFADKATGRTFCGILEKDDPHAQMHIRTKLGCYFYDKGDIACGVCGAPLCEVCQATVRKFFERRTS